MRDFLCDKNTGRMEDQKPGPGLVGNQVFAKEEKLEPNIKTVIQNCG